MRHSTPGMIQRARDLRRSPTPAEARLWLLLRNRQLAGYKFRRQAVIGGYIADFYCPGRQLVVELDGGHHLCADQRAYDEERTRWLSGSGIRVLRFRNREIFAEPAVVLERIREALEE